MSLRKLIKFILFSHIFFIYNVKGYTYNDMIQCNNLTFFDKLSYMEKFI